MSLARSIPKVVWRGTASSLTMNRCVVRSSHTVNINLNIGKDLHIEGLDTGKIVVKQIDHGSNSPRIQADAVSVGQVVNFSLSKLNNSQLQQLLASHYELSELSNFVEEHKLTGNFSIEMVIFPFLFTFLFVTSLNTGTNLFYGVESVDDLEIMGLNRIQARTLCQLIQVWKEEGLPLTQATNFQSHSPAEVPLVSTSVKDDEVSERDRQIQQVLSRFQSGIVTEEPSTSMKPSAEEEAVEPDAELMEWYAQLDIAFVNARWGGQTQQVKLIQQAAESGEDFLAEAYWSILCEKGCPGVDENHLQAVHYARRALPWLLQEASKGNPYAQYNLGFCYTDGRGVPPNVTKAAQLYELAAAQGHEGARVSLGICYERGEGVEKDPVMAAACFRGAYSHPNALHSYAYCLANGVGVEKNRELARFYYTQAADMGHVDAQYVVGKFYAEDPEESDIYLKMAATQGHKEAMRMCGYRVKD